MRITCQALLLVVAIIAGEGFPSRAQADIAPRGSAPSVYVPMSWERSREADTIRRNMLGEGVKAALALPTYADNVWDSGSYTPAVNRAAVPPGVQWASWPNRYAVESRHLRATFTFPRNLNPALAEGVLFDPYYSDDVLPINDNVYIFLNGQRLFVGGTAYGAVNAGYLGTAPVANETDGWYIPGGIRLAGFRRGVNVLDLVVEDYWGWGGIGYVALRVGPRPRLFLPILTR